MAKKDSAKVVLGMPTDDWQAQNDLDTLTRAADIRKDPKRMKAVQALAKNKLAELARLSVDPDGDAGSEPDGNDD